MTKTELEAWALDEFWPRYKNLMKVPFRTKWTGGDRGDAVTAIGKLNPSQELREAILAALSEQALHRAKLFKKLDNDRQRYEKHTKEAGLKVYYNRNGSTWVNNKGWRSEIPSLSLIEEPAESKGHTCIWCPNEVKTKGNLCKPCNEQYLSRFTHDWSIAKGIFHPDDDQQTKVRKCKQYLKESGYKTGVLKNVTGKLVRSK